MDKFVERSQILRALVKSNLIGYVSLAPLANDSGEMFSIAFSSILSATGSAVELLACIEKCNDNATTLEILCERAGLIKSI
jgi:hypothetical protein